MRAVPLTANIVVFEAHDLCQPVKLNRQSELVAITLRERVARMDLDMGEWKLRPLAGIMTAPVLAADGSIRDVEGYDPETGLWCCRVPKLVVAERPSIEDAKTRRRPCLVQESAKGCWSARSAQSLLAFGGVRSLRGMTGRSLKNGSQPIWCKQPTLFLDNVNGAVLRSDTLATAITERPARIRVFGELKMVVLNSTAFIAITGNGLTMSEDR